MRSRPPISSTLGPRVCRREELGRAIRVPALPRHSRLEPVYGDAPYGRPRWPHRSTTRPVFRHRRDECHHHESYFMSHTARFTSHTSDDATPKTKPIARVANTPIRM